MLHTTEERERSSQKDDFLFPYQRGILSECPPYFPVPDALVNCKSSAQQWLPALSQEHNNIITKIPRM